LRSSRCRSLGSIFVAALLAFGGLSISSGEAAAKSEPTRSRSAKKPTAKAGKKVAKKATRGKDKRKSAKRSRKRGRKVNYFSGRRVTPDELRATPVEKPSGKVWIFAEHLHEEVKVAIYRPDGTLDDDALAKLDEVFRCRRTGEVRAVDPRLFETLSVISDRFGGKRINLVSGFRFQRNEGSRHYHASAMDLRIDGVSERELYDFARSLDSGGMGIGIYPRSGFVHVDYRAPGEGSYRWTDRSPPDGNAPTKRPSARFKPRS
jgi:uncharacterized protein YcbK (DUF882 family)